MTPERPPTWLHPQSGGVPNWRPNALTAPFWDGVERGELLYQRCAECGAAVFNPAPVCRTCTSRELRWERSNGTGAVYSYTICHRPMTPAFTTPYAPIIVDLDEGYQMLSNLIGCDAAEVAVGLRVRVEFHSVGDRTLPYFVPSRGAARA